MGVSKRRAVFWAGASFAILAAGGWMCALLVSCPRLIVKFVSRPGVEITAAIPMPGPRLVAIEDDDRELQEDLEPCTLPGVRPISPLTLALSQITWAQSLSLSILTSAQRPLRC
jgi:hypothetical protein